MGKRIVTPAVHCEKCGHIEKYEVVQYVCDHCGDDIEEEKREDHLFPLREIGRWRHLLALEKRKKGVGMSHFLENSDEYHFCCESHKWLWIKDHLDEITPEKYIRVHEGISHIRMIPAFLAMIDTISQSFQ